MNNEKIASELVKIAKELVSGNGFFYYGVNYTYNGGRIWLSILFAEKSSIDKWEKNNPEIEIKKVNKVRSSVGYVTVDMRDRYTETGDDFKALGAIHDSRGSYQTTAYAPRKRFSQGKKDYDKQQKKNGKDQADYYSQPWV